MTEHRELRLKDAVADVLATALTKIPETQALLRGIALQAGLPMGADFALDLREVVLLLPDGEPVEE
jgi:hypothetical protein